MLTTSAQVSVAPRAEDFSITSVDTRANLAYVDYTRFKTAFVYNEGVQNGLFIFQPFKPVV